MNKRIFFGTDGIRGKVGSELMTPDFVLELGKAAGTVFNGKNKILVTRDTRLSGEMLQAALSSGICSTGVAVCDLGVLPTPACAYLTKYLNAEAGVVISASHNPYYDNGVKFFSHNGSKLTDHQEFSIENIILTNRSANTSLISPNRIGEITSDYSLAKHYVHFCLDVVKNVNNEESYNNIKKLKVVLDCANGATYMIAPEVFGHLDFDLTLLNNAPNGFNINQDSGAADNKGLEILSKTVRTRKADIGIALDGDGDRVILVSPKGHIIDGDQILYILANHYLANNVNLTGVVGTQMTNLGLEKALTSKGLAFERVKVGDRYVLEKLLEKNWILGGETSGHILNLDKSTTGDGLLTALMVLTILAQTQKTLDELLKGYDKYPQVMINVNLADTSQDVLGLTSVQSAIADLSSQLNSKGRVIVRQSGTEAVVRVMVEGESSREVEHLAIQLSDFIKSEIK